MGDVVRRVLITGIGGMLGRALGNGLAREGHAVFGLDIQEPNGLNAGIAFSACDVRDTHRLYKVMAPMPTFDAVVHAGGVSGSMVLRDNPAAIIEINVTGTVNLLEAAKLHGTNHFVLCSSIMAYGSVQGATVDEDVALAPVNPYGASKAAAEAILRSYCEEFGMSGAALRIAHVYGPSRMTYCPLGELVKAAVGAGSVTLRTARQTKRQFIHARDVVTALSAAVLVPRIGFQAVNIGPGTEHRLSDVAELVEAHVGPLSVEYLEQRVCRDYSTPILAIEQAKRLYGWQPEVTLVEGVEDYARVERARAK